MNYSIRRGNVRFTAEEKYNIKRIVKMYNNISDLTLARSILTPKLRTHTVV